MYEEDETLSEAEKEKEKSGEKEKSEKTGAEPEKQEQKTAIEIEEMLVPKYTEALACGLNALTLSNMLVSELPLEDEVRLLVSSFFQMRETLPWISRFFESFI